jgi:thiol:disulfide interchange protein DsbC
LAAVTALAMLALSPSGRAQNAPAAVKPAAPAVGQAAPAAPLDPDTLAVQKLIEDRIPGMEVRGIVKTDIAGLYEVLADDRIVYVDPKVNFLFMGSIYDLASKQNLTEDRFRQLNRIAFNSLPFDQSFKRVRGDGSRKMAIFSDADCPFCARIEKELVGMNNVTIYTFPFPIDSLHPDSSSKSRRLWCSADRGKAWDAWFSTGKLPDNKGDCANPVVANQALGEKLKISATPTMIFADGTVVPGALPLAQIEQLMAKADANGKLAKQ